jgi:hypothetical protein
MNNRTSVFLWLVLLSTSACTSSAPVESHVGERLERFTRRTKAEVRAKAERHRMREQARASGKRVCEEGDWPQRWAEDCNTCGCDIGEVRWCTDARCRAPGWRTQQQQEPQRQGPLTEDSTSSTNVESVESVGSQLGKRLEKLTRRTKGELKAKADRNQIRERLRAAGALFCEEGEWPQEWWDGCQWCWCDIRSQVRSCEFGIECDPEVERKLREQAVKDELENPHRVRK